MSKDLICRVIVCCHKQDVHASEPPYFPIQVGKASSKTDLSIQGDNSGENISNKNYCYCELTGMYWAWKNLKGVDVIGLCHYRRYFDFHRQGARAFPYTVVKTADFDSVDLSISDSIIQRVYNGEIIMPKPMNYRYNLMVEYCTSHISDDYRVLRNVIKETQPQEIQDAFYEVFYQNNKLMHFNMFLMNWNEFDAYCSWLFPILEELEKRIDISNYNDIQKRIFGYMSERLLNVWTYSRRTKISRYPVLWINDADNILAHYSPAKYKVRCLLNNVGNLFLRHTNNNF